MYTRMFFFMLLISVFSCKPEGENSGKTLDEIKIDGVPYADIIRNPASANGPTDTVNVAKITFEEAEYNFGDVPEGTVVEHVFKFKNTGKIPLLISNARSTCGCTVPKWPKEPIAPGQGGEISVKFDTRGKTSVQKKPVTITANTYPATSIVVLYGAILMSENARNGHPD